MSPASVGGSRRLRRRGGGNALPRGQELQVLEAILLRDLDLADEVGVFRMAGQTDRGRAAGGDDAFLVLDEALQQEVEREIVEVAEVGIGAEGDGEAAFLEQ